MDGYIKRKYPTVTITKSPSKKQQAIQEQLQQLYIQVKESEDLDEFHLEVLKARLSDRVVLEALVTLIVVRNLSYNLVEWAEFHTLYQALNKAYKGRILTSHSIIYIKTRDA